MDHITLKAALRKSIRTDRMDMSDRQVVQASQAIFDKWLGSFNLDPVYRLHLFQQIKKFNEVDTSLFMKWLDSHKSHIKQVVPVVKNNTADLMHFELAKDIEMKISSWGIPEPSAPRVRVYPMQIDMVLVPMLAFDQVGHRLGYGKGYYDRFLAQVHPKCLKIGLCYEAGKQASNLPTNQFDVSLDYIVTEEQIYSFSPNK